VVVTAGWKGGFGRAVEISHGYGYRTLYGHNSRLAVRVGQSVKKGQVIAYAGSSGRSTGSHVHYSVFVNGRVVNPRDYLR
jgi:murein DD-endopeptidase MepM/ murein hydrolase activator NlpD